MTVPKTFEVAGTSDDHRKVCPYDFVVAMNPSLAKQLKLKDGVVVLREIDDKDNKEGEKKTPLRVYGIILGDSKLERHQLRMDQTLRNALGVPFEAGRHERKDLKLFPLVLNWKQKFRAFITAFLGKRYLFFRVAKPHPPDIEKNICRVPKDALALMGTAEGNRIVLVSCVEKEKGSGLYTLKNYSVRAFDLNESMRSQRKEEEDKEFKESKGWAARYVDAPKLLSVEPDIAPIFIDLHIRHELNVEPGDPIKARRDFPDLFKHQLLEVGIVLAISAIALNQLLPSEFRKEFYLPFVVIIGLGSLLFACLIVLLRLRSRVR